MAIALRLLEAGQTITGHHAPLTLSHTTLEGHRFAVQPIPAGQPLISWGLPFGRALTDIVPGDYICNRLMLDALHVREVPFPLPHIPNFQDYQQPFHLDTDGFRAGSQVALHASPGTFMGFDRGSTRGAGTRNFIAVLGTSSRTAAFARALAKRFRDLPAEFGSIDGVIPIAHTEGGGPSQPNNLELVLRTLAGFMTHPNLGAVLAVDLGTEPVSNQLLQTYLADHNYSLGDLPHHFLSLRRDYSSDLQAGEKIIRSWLETVNRSQRTPQPLAKLKIALQCGGSDAFSGVSGNPLAGWIARELIRHGGSANLAETSELIGAESYVLRSVRDLPTVRKFLSQVDYFQEWAGWHGHSAEGNPSGGNLYRGLYNIVIKSIGAARKKDPDVRLDYAIDYSEPMRSPGFYFMDSPGNDLESIAGQVAAGCNLILFITGNGSVTNFPFVPTIKIVTTTQRYELLKREMDINAGRYLDGTPIDELGAEGFALTCAVASGQLSVGETAGHSQVQLWRDWRQTDPGNLPELSRGPRPSGEPLCFSTEESAADPAPTFRAFSTPRGPATDQIALILPTSLCSGQIAQMIAQQINRQLPVGVTRCVALPHTEGCGVSRGESEKLYLRTLAGYACHPIVRRALLLEHGCEKTHNDEIRLYLQQQNADTSHFGWASIQLDGGIDAVSVKVIDWFNQTLAGDPLPQTAAATLGKLHLGLLSELIPPDEFTNACVRLTRSILTLGGSVVLPSTSPLASPLLDFLRSPSPTQPTLQFGEGVSRPGLHLMHTPTDQPSEILVGLGATGASLMLAYVSGFPWSAHPMIPLLQVGPSSHAVDLDLVWPPPEDPLQSLLNLMVKTAERTYIPKLMAQGNVDFQVTRGLVGVSL